MRASSHAREAVREYQVDERITELEYRRRIISCRDGSDLPSLDDYDRMVDELRPLNRDELGLSARYRPRVVDAQLYSDTANAETFEIERRRMAILRGEHPDSGMFGSAKEYLAAVKELGELKPEERRVYGEYQTMMLDFFAGIDESYDTP